MLDLNYSTVLKVYIILVKKLLNTIIYYILHL